MIIIVQSARFTHMCKIGAHEVHSGRTATGLQRIRPDALAERRVG